MKRVSKTKRVFQNSRVSFFLFLTQVFLGFYSRKVFLEYLGAEILGVHTTLGNILSFLNLAELGIGLAMATSLYKPISQDDRNTICEIISVQGILYRRIAIGLCLTGLAITSVLPFCYPNTECGTLYVCISFIVFLSGSIFSYLWNYKQILIQADQKNYKLLPWIHGVRFLKTIIQIVVLVFLHGGIWGWIVLEFVSIVMTTIFITRVVRKEYPWLQSGMSNSELLLRRHHNLIKTTKQLFIHKLAFFVLDQTSPLVIYAFVSLSMVTYYGNYMLLMGYAVTLTNVIFDGMGASVGSLVADSNNSHTKRIFWELFSLRFWTTGAVCMGLYLFIEPFITLWIGKEYLLGKTTLLLLLTNVFIRMSRGVVDSFRDAYQLFDDIWAPVIEAVINLGCSILFGYLWGLNGILLGCNISLILMIVIWKPYYLFRKGFKESSKKYFFVYSYHVFVMSAMAFFFVMSTYPSENVSTSKRIVLSTITFVLYTSFSFLILLNTTRGLKDFTKRIINIIQHKI